MGFVAMSVPIRFFLRHTWILGVPAVLLGSIGLYGATESWKTQRSADAGAVLVAVLGFATWPVLHVLAGLDAKAKRSRARGDGLEPWQRWATSLPALMCSLTCRERGLTHGTRQEKREGIAKWWGVKDLAGAREMLDRLVQGSTGPAFRAACAEVERLGSKAQEHANPQVRFVWERRADVPPQGILAWDLGRVVSLTRSVYTAGYMTEEESWRWIAAAAREAQKSFPSWRSWGASYAFGYQFWLARGVNVPDPVPFPKTLDERLNDPRSPWVELSWYDGAVPEPGLC
jgi:hypothetical protein